MKNEILCKVLTSQGEADRGCQTILWSINTTRTKNTAENTDANPEILMLLSLPCKGPPFQQNEPLQVQKELREMVLSFRDLTGV